MSLLSATVLRVTPIGKTRDFCPLCRQERRFRLANAEHRRVILLLDRGPVGHPHHELTCMSCGCKMERPAEERPIAHAPPAEARESFEPECLAIVKRRIDTNTKMELARRAGKLTPQGREEMIRGAVHCFARIYDEQPTERVTPAMSGLLLVATLALGGLAAYLWRAHEQPMLAGVCAVAVVLMWCGLWYWIVSQSPRHKVRAWLARALAPLDPSVEEIRQARRELQAIRMGAGYKIRSAKVRAKIDKIRRTGAAHP